jgi:ABC-2 type transport system permease protein
MSYLKLVWAYQKLNLKAQLEYRGAFISQVGAMFLNDCVWVVFWYLFFTRFPVLKGWDVRDVMTVWATAACGFGLAHAVCGNALRLSELIVNGQLDAWLLYPRAVLPHLLLGKMNAVAVGDAVFGIAAYLFFVRPDAAHFLLFLTMALSTSILFLGFSILAGSLAFFIGNAKAVAEQWQFAVITFSTYPGIIFDGWVKILLFTAIPALFVSYFPVLALKNLSFVDAGFAFAGALGTLIVGVIAFHVGLKRYESGNLMTVRD